MRVVGEAGDGGSALDRLAVLERARGPPDVVLMDLQMPKRDGVAATAAIKQRWAEVDGVAVTSFVEETGVRAALEAGDRVPPSRLRRTQSHPQRRTRARMPLKITTL